MGFRASNMFLIYILSDICLYKQNFLILCRENKINLIQDEISKVTYVMLYVVIWTYLCYIMIFINYKRIFHICHFLKIIQSNLLQKCKPIYLKWHSDIDYYNRCLYFDICVDWQRILSRPYRFQQYNEDTFKTDLMKIVVRVELINSKFNLYVAFL